MRLIAVVIVLATFAGCGVESTDSVTKVRVHGTECVVYAQYSAKALGLIAGVPYCPVPQADE